MARNNNRGFTLLEKEGHLRRSSLAGFTLLEFIVVASISLFLVGAAITISLAGRKSFEIGDARITLQQELRKAEDWIVDELHQGGQGTVSNVPANGVWYNQIAFRIPSTVIAGRIVWVSSQTQYSLGGAGGKQLLRSGQDGQTVFANDISSFQVRRQASSPYIVEFAFVGEKTTIVGDTINANLNFSVKMRN